MSLIVYNVKLLKRPIFKFDLTFMYFQSCNYPMYYRVTDNTLWF